MQWKHHPWSPLLDLINYSWLNDPNNSLGGRLGEWGVTACIHTHETHTHVCEAMSPLCLMCSTEVLMLICTCTHAYLSECFPLSLISTLPLPDFHFFTSSDLPGILTGNHHGGTVLVKNTQRACCCSSALAEVYSKAPTGETACRSASEANSTFIVCSWSAAWGQVFLTASLCCSCHVGGVWYLCRLHKAEVIQDSSPSLVHSSAVWLTYNNQPYHSCRYQIKSSQIYLCSTNSQHGMHGKTSC